MDLESIELFEGVPVSIQLKTPLANHGSLEEVEVEGRKCGRAGFVEQQQKDGQRIIQPISLWQGSIHQCSDAGIVFDTLGHLEAPLRIFIPHDMIAAVFFAKEHVQQKEESKILS